MGGVVLYIHFTERKQQCIILGIYLRMNQLGGAVSFCRWICRQWSATTSPPEPYANLTRFPTSIEASNFQVFQMIILIPLNKLTRSVGSLGADSEGSQSAESDLRLRMSDQAPHCVFGVQDDREQDILTRIIPD